jgi:transcription antitermination factor NusA-like protein
MKMEILQMLLTLKILLPGIPIGLVLGLAISLYWIAHPVKFERLKALLCRGLSCLNERWEYGRVAMDLQATINNVGEQIDKQAPKVLPHALKIEWVKDGDEEAILRRGEIIVRLNRYESQDRNLVVATLKYLGRGLLPRARSYIDDRLRRSTEYTVAKRVFGSARAIGASDYFFKEILKPVLKEEPDLRKDCDLLDTLDGAGYFSRIFLTEVREFGERTLPATPTRDHAGEIRAFAEFLYTVAKERRKIKLHFPGVKIKVATILVAKEETVRQWGLSPHLRRIKMRVREGIDSIYLCGRGENINLVRELARMAEQTEQIRILRSYVYPLTPRRGKKGIVIACQSNESFLRKEAELIKPVREAFEQYVPEINEGQVEILGIVRRKGIGAKVAVRSIYEDIDVVRCCLGLDEDRIEQVRNALEGEWVGIIKWSYKPEEFIINSLFPLRRWDITGVSVDEDLLEAVVVVKDERTARLAIGEEGFNVRLAQELTGWKIEIQTSASIGQRI